MDNPEINGASGLSGSLDFLSLLEQDSSDTTGRTPYPDPDGSIQLTVHSRPPKDAQAQPSTFKQLLRTATDNFEEYLAKSVSGTMALDGDPDAHRALDTAVSAGSPQETCNDLVVTDAATAIQDMLSEPMAAGHVDGQYTDGSSRMLDVPNDTADMDSTEAGTGSDRYQVSHHGA